MTVADSLVRPEALNYLAGLSLDPAQLPPRSSWAPIPNAARRLELVRGIGLAGAAHENDDVAAFPTEAVLAGLAGERLPFAFQVVGRADGIRFMVGTWADDGDGAELDQQHAVLTALLDGVYPSVDRHTAEIPQLGDLAIGGLVHGVPAGEVRGGEAPWDRLLRGLYGANFAVVVLAEPVEPASIVQLRDIALDDLRAALSGEWLIHLSQVGPLGAAAGAAHRCRRPRAGAGCAVLGAVGRRQAPARRPLTTREPSAPHARARCLT